jgi:hypothetical protein
VTERERERRSSGGGMRRNTNKMEEIKRIL